MLKKILLITAFASAACFGANAQKFGVIFSNQVISVMPETKAAQEALDAEQKKLEGELAPMMEQLTKKEKEVREILNDNTKSDALKQVSFEEYQAMGQKVQNFRQAAAESIQKKQQELMEPVLNKVKDAVNAVSAADGLTFVQEAEQAGILYWGGNATDITAKVKTKLGLK
ncbi:MAG: OmpH family outer membrane protein [Muribaculaceae bacterium]|nr:OmpH family outer membrane protein [Muribaculaceae bacterium]